MNIPQPIIQKATALISIFIMFLVAQALFYDVLVLAYGVAILYSIVRWKLAENNCITVPNTVIKWLFKAIFLYWGIMFGAGGNHYSTIIGTKSPIAGIILNIVGFLFVYDILRFFNKIEVRQYIAPNNQK